LQKSAALPAPSETLWDKWATSTQGHEGGKLLGHLERFLFLGVFWIDAPIVVVAWLAFKVTSKWNAWSNVITVPKKSRVLTNSTILSRAVDGVRNHS